MIQIRILIVLMVLISGVVVASATTTQYPLASVAEEDDFKIKSVFDTRFTAANNNVINELEVSVSIPVGVSVLNVTTPDYVVMYTTTKTKTGILERTLVRNIKIYKNNVLVENISNTWTGSSIVLSNTDTLTLKSQTVYVKKGPTYTGEGPVNNFSSSEVVLPTYGVLISTPTASTVYLHVINVALASRYGLEDDLNPVFSAMYWLLTLSPFYKDADGGLLSFMYVFSISMDAILWLIWLSITSTFSVFAYIEAGITFYAGWRNNKLKGFMDNMVKWHIAIGKAIAGAIYALFIIVYDFIKSVVPGIG